MKFKTAASLELKRLNKTKIMCLKISCKKVQKLANEMIEIALKSLTTLK